MEITKYRSQLFIALERAGVHLRQVQHTLTKLQRNIVDRSRGLREVLLPNAIFENHLWNLLRRGQIALTGWGRSVTDKSRGLWEALRARENDVWKILTASRHAIRAANGKVANLRTQLYVAWGQVPTRLQQGQSTLTGWGRSVTDKSRGLWEALRARENDVRKILTASRDAIRAANGKVVKLRTQLYVAWGQVSARVQQGQNTLTGLGRSVIDKPRRLKKSLLMRENHLRKLLASSPDAIVVTNVEHRFVAANRKGLDLFGVSETNLRTFTIALFFSRAQILEFQGIGSRARRRGETHSKCEIRRLDGSLRIAEYTYVANFAPSQHLYRFRNIVTTNQQHPLTGHAVANQPCSGTGLPHKP
jgi:PAS domain S-box-containing protein